MVVKLKVSVKYSKKGVKQKWQDSLYPETFTTVKAH